MSQPIVVRPVGFWSRLDAALGGWVQGWNPYTPDKLKHRTLQPVAVEESVIRKSAAKLFLLFFALFLVWAFTAPLDAGVSVSGSVKVQGNRKAVQHPSGGVVEEILVKEGARVTEGDVLLRVNPLNTQANLTTLELQLFNQLATESRMKSERDGLGSIRWAPELNAPGLEKDPRVAEAKALQAQLFSSRRAEYASQVASLNQQINALKSVLRSNEQQMQSLRQEAQNTRQLAQGGFVPEFQANAAERQRSALESSMSTTQSEIARAQLQIAQLRTSQLKEVDDQLSTLQASRDATVSRLEAARFDRKLSELKATATGTVVGLQVFTTGGVITSAQVLMEIVPDNQGLIVEAKVPPQDIDKVRKGMATDLRFTAFAAATTPVVLGTVSLVGADLQPANGQDTEHYLAQIEATAEGLALLGGLQVQPGMPVEVIFKSGERSFMSYLLKPLTDRLAKAFLN
jgi:protease secretion system membrane fusion protein